MPFLHLHEKDRQTLAFIVEQRSEGYASVRFETVMYGTGMSIGRCGDCLSKLVNKGLLEQYGEAYSLTLAGMSAL